MSPQVPIRLLTMVLLLIAVLDVIVMKVGWRPLALTALAVAAGLLLAAVADSVRKTTASLGLQAWEVGPSLAPLAPASHAAGAPTAEAPVTEPSVSRRAAYPRWAPEAVALVSRFAVLLLVVTTVMALRTALALELLAQ
jgi:hypothetical protein